MDTDSVQLLPEEHFEHYVSQIIDGLAEKGYAVVDNFIGKNELEPLLNNKHYWEEHEAFKKAGIGSQNQFQLNRQVRGDYIKWIEEEKHQTPATAFLTNMRQLMERLNQSCFLGLKDLESHFAIYPVGTAYQRHSDCFKQNTHRVISFVLYLNEDWKAENGGQLMIYPEGQQAVEVMPLAGRLVCFRSEIEHEVLTAHRERASITGWMLSQLKELTYL